MLREKNEEKREGEAKRISKTKIKKEYIEYKEISKKSEKIGRRLEDGLPLKR